MQWYLGAFKKYIDFSGRARRKEFWYFTLFNFIVTAVLVIIDVSMAGASQKATFGMLSMIYALVVLLPSLGVSVRRLHDIDRSGWWLLIGLVPLIGTIVLL
ncbi:MAG: DUF805 domain-containing protein, partial [Gammaproteobacteria bacterium]